MSSPWYKRFLTSTRGQVIALLRRSPRTVDELAQQLDLTDNAVRAHLSTLERDGLVRQRGVRRSGGSGKPAYAYELTLEANQLFPTPYADVLGEVLAALNDQIPPAEVEALLQVSGRRLAKQRPAVQGDLRARLEAAVAALNQLGGLAELDEGGEQLVIRGYSCPLAALAPNHPEVCRLAESFVSEVAGVPLYECCEDGPTPHCCFAPVAP